MKKTLATLATAGALALTSSFAMAADDQENKSPISATLSISEWQYNAAITHIEDIGSLQACLDAAWVHSFELTENGKTFSNNVTVHCVENGKTIGAQMCSKGKCQALTPISTRRP
jgi:hypothetical protein